MTDAELLIECKRGLGAPVAGTNLDGVLTQKLLAVKSFMDSAGVSDTIMSDDLALSVIVLGVTDIWNLEGGETKFSPVFYTLLSQLVIGSSLLTVCSSPVDGAVGVELDVQPVLTFNKRIKSYEVSILDYNTKDPVALDYSLDVTGKILTLEPGTNLDSATKYALIIDNAVSYLGPELDYTVLSFTTK